jgi:hypothetical protein
VAFWLTGPAVIDGATAVPPDPVPPERVAAKTFSVPALLVTLPALLVTTTVNSARLMDIVAGGVVYEEEIAPLMALPFIRHW